MRIIKFRAWGTFGKNMNYQIQGEDLWCFLRRVSGMELMQYTGLKDKNGVEIYEGDILDNDGIVEWNEVEYRWSVKDKGYDGYDQWHPLEYKNCPIEVTGNIHENKQLLNN